MGQELCAKTGEGGGGAGRPIEYLPFRRVPLIPAADIPVADYILCVARFGFDFSKSLYNSRYFFLFSFLAFGFCFVLKLFWILPVTFNWFYGCTCCCCCIAL